MALSKLGGLVPSTWPRLPSWRVLLAVGVTAAALGAAALGAWLWVSAQERRGLQAFAGAMINVQRSQAADAGPQARATAVKDLEAVLHEQTPAAVSAQVTYELGNLKYQERQYSAARTAYELTAAGSSPTLHRLAQANLGYIWEAEKDYAKAIAAFDGALAPLKAGDFLYEELLIDLGRVQELAGRKDDAVQTYRRILENPRSRRAEDIKLRLAALGVSPRASGS